MLFLKLLPSLANNHSASTHSWHFIACCWLFFCWPKSLWDCEQYSSSLSFHFCTCETAHGAQQPSHNMLFACPNRKVTLNSPNGSLTPNVSHFLLNVRGGQQFGGGLRDLWWCGRLCIMSVPWKETQTAETQSSGFTQNVLEHKCLCSHMHIHSRTQL